MDLGMSLSHKDLLMSSPCCFFCVFFSALAKVNSFLTWPPPPRVQTSELLPRFTGSALSPCLVLTRLGAFQLRLDTWALKECFL